MTSRGLAGEDQTSENGADLEKQLKKEMSHFKTLRWGKVMCIVAEDSG